MPDADLPNCRVCHSLVCWANCPIVSIPPRRSFSAVLGPMPHSLSTASGSRNARSSPGSTTTRPSGLRMSEAILATDLLVAAPTDTVNPVSRLTWLFRRRATARGRPVVGSHSLRDIQVSLVQGQGFHQWSEAEENVHNLFGQLPVPGEAWTHDYPLGAQSHRRFHGHSRMYPEHPGFVGSRSHHTSAFRPPPDQDRLPPQVGIVQLFHGRVESVQVGVKNVPFRRLPKLQYLCCVGVGQFQPST